MRTCFWNPVLLPSMSEGLSTTGKQASAAVDTLKFAVLTAALVLGACDNGGSVVNMQTEAAPQTPTPAPGVNPGDGTVDPGPVNMPGNVGVPTLIEADATIPSLASGVRAQAYTGNFNDDVGVFIINDDNRLIGLVDAGDGQSISVRADIDASVAPASTVLSRFTHQRQSSTNNQITSDVLSAFALPDVVQSESSMDIVDGVQITSTSGDISYALQVADAQVLTPVSSDSLQGQWSSNYATCDSRGEQCSTITFNLLVDGSTFAGSAGVLASDGTDLLPSTLSGTLVQRGGVVDVEMIWNTYRYNGFAYVGAAEPALLNIVLTTDSEIADERMLALTMVRLRT